ncbi:MULTISPECIES: penicillin-binding protein 2 [unclassified Roseofilum]|uniref:penicillin-binding protein 2 n=1 Tax=unclassified Roseofilum TaxID=2620099 RepID=UPI000E8BF400|nr:MULTISPECIES: penicillin-binding protein 2 [unclassified Roseofilum]HBQ97698.1 penicillin-binding protein 2 [Cyanobacteria bacterium UBA11691]MBP0009685.1 penicillin-binding protein 2 [Roseofilum sp. Belize Diploria]MBP0011590.1 penicillin-binding protein 2 [Roseofilum sp. SID3]MBP0024070.1 penicillin-binding protein 2 [Roseofilum sp. SID2]MBP0034049.1 penicillin-binding protein 2 [Roseofilum sp. Belize BBD 4]
MTSISSWFAESTPAKISRKRLPQTLVIVLIFTSMFTAYTWKLAELQIIRGKENRERADSNRIRQMPVPSDRGNIFDRQGKILVSNRLSRSVYLWPKERSPEEWEIQAQQLATVLNISPKEIIDQLAADRYQSRLPIRIYRNLSLEEFTALSEFNLIGVEIRSESNRLYPHGTLASHAIGYVGEATHEELDANPDYPMGMIVGQMGVERLANEQLKGQWGGRLVEVNAKGEELRELGLYESRSGDSVQLTLDLELQKAAEQALRNRRGAVVALDVKTGGVLAMASGPTFDPQIFTRRVTPEEWEELQGEDQPFLNRALQGYPPGSTFKIVTAAAGMESGKFSPYSMLMTSAYITVGGIQFHEHSGGYGAIGFRDALAYSSNTFFYKVGMEAGVKAIAEWAEKMGIGKTTDLSLLGLEGGRNGSVPTPEQKQDLYGEPWYPGDTVSMSIGQGLVLASPLELAVMIGSIANGGMRVKPHLLASQTNIQTMQPEPTGLSPDTIAAIREGLVAVVQKGTGRGMNDGSIPLTAGKTGTSEVLGQQSHAVYVGYGPVSDPQVAIAVVVENGGYGGKTALPVAQAIFQAYFRQ